MKKSIFCISIDHELLWGRRNINYEKYINNVKKEREIITRILNLFKNYKIPATWAVVGKILEDGDKLWHGKDTIEQIKKVEGQELAYHSYSHKIITTISKKEALIEIKKGKIGTTFIFPQNKVAYLDLLKEHGYTAYRGKDKHKIELLLPSVPPVYDPIIRNGLVNIPGSLYFVSSRGLRKFIPFGLRYLKSVLGIKNAIKQKGIFHLWFHPIDFTNNSELLLIELEMILKYASNLKKQGLLDIQSMSRIVKKYKDN